MDGDRERWNTKWSERAGELAAPARFIVDQAARLPARGRALDVAAGGGRHAIWLAQRGLAVTVVDISDVAVEQAEQHARAAGVADRMRFLRIDLDAPDPLPLAPVFDAMVIVHYLNRARRDALAALLAPGGVLLATQPTVHNLERHAHPSRAYCVEPGELTAWAERCGLVIEHAHEGWTADGRHEAELVARRPAGA